MWPKVKRLCDIRLYKVKEQGGRSTEGREKRKERMTRKEKEVKV
jgi:hypothetical protein